MVVVVRRGTGRGLCCEVESKGRGGSLLAAILLLLARCHSICHTERLPLLLHFALAALSRGGLGLKKRRTKREGDGGAGLGMAH